MAANVFGDSIIIPGGVSGAFVGFGSDEATAVTVKIGTGSPDGVVTSLKGSVFLQLDAPDLWQNTDGATAWEKVGLQS